MSSACVANCTNQELFHDNLIEDYWSSWNVAMDYFEYQPWFFSLLGSFMVGLSGVLPLLIIPIEAGTNLKNGAGAGTLKLLLSFAVGGLLGDVFLHLLPEAWASKTLAQAHNNNSQLPCGLWVLFGFLVFIVAEKMFINEGENNSNEMEEKKEIKSTDDYLFKKVKEFENNNFLTSSDNDIITKLKNTSENQHPSVVELKLNFNKLFNGYKTTTKNGILIYPQNEIVSNIIKKNGFKSCNDILTNEYYTNGFVSLSSKCSNEFDLIKKYKKNEIKLEEKIEKPKHISGYLNLMANCIDNFTHGLAVGGSFLISFRLGALTTFAILVHEIPHEVGDFAILLRSGFSRWDAAKAQLITASGGIFGAMVAVICSGNSVESRTSWILPFTAGGFLHIGLVSVLPELLKETNPKESLKQLGALLAGITIMAFLTIICD
ncbi:zinc transporter ZIP13 homolog [Leptopilina boulardi]|uniref:zinc transporter ZIP13 homolog n=1 Tax=Leptopilina boulardi TaxID=63433 RepID=UPI0021F56892|nr:zinc transporter ZIP13 homolog [Leptopilina boulardi]